MLNGSATPSRKGDEPAKRPGCASGFSRGSRMIVLGLPLISAILLPALAFGAEDSLSVPTMTHRMMMLALQLGVIVIAARLGNILFTRIGLPGVVGELMTGVVIGPYVLGRVPLPGFPDGLFHLHDAVAVGSIPVSPELYGICTVASIVLLFLVGLETDIGLFLRYSVAGSAVGVGGVAVSFLMGDLMAILFSPMLFGERLGFFDAPCLFLGIISTATSVGITARILSENRKLDSPEGVTILAGAVIDDVLGMILLAIGMGIITASRASGGVDWGHIGAIAVKAVAVWMAATVLGLAAARRISTLLKAFRDLSVIAIMALGLAMILAGLFEEAGLAMIIGAYVMGLSLSKTDLRHVIREKLYPIHVFLVPVFFTVMGMLVDVRALTSREVLLFGLLYTAVAAAAKVIGCGLPALFVNFNLRGALRIGTGMLPRGEVTLIIAGTGLAAGLLNPRIFGVVVFMTAAAALAAPPIIVALFRSPKSGVRHVPPGETGLTEIVFSFPSALAAEFVVDKLLRAFESEGFFVHTLNRAERLYQLRKERTVITFRQREGDIVFDARESEVPFINTAMVEVVADLERAIRELRKPLDLASISRRVQEGGAPPAAPSLLRRHLHRDLLVAELKGATKSAVINELLDLLCRKGYVKNRDDALQAVMEREESMSTGMQYGIAIPHGRTDAVDSLVCAIGIQPSGVDFDAVDGKPSRIIVLTLSPRNAASPYMQFMSMISQALNEQGRAALLACDNEDDMYAVLTGAMQPQQRRSMMGLVGRRGERKPSLGDFLQRDLLIPDLRAETKEEVIDELLGVLAATGRIPGPGAVREAILERERQMSTGMEHGIALPHARTDAVRDLLCVIGVRREGIDFGSLDGAPSRIFVLTLTPEDGAARYLELMSMISRVLDETGRKRVLGASSAEEMWNILVKEET